MGMVVRTNTMALNAYRQLGMNNNAVTKSLEKLSSGFRINRAGDDAAGLAISEKMKAQITGLETASANAQDGISLIQTAEGNLTEVHSMLNRMVELASKSANGTYTSQERSALQAEVDSLLEEIDRISKSANFNGTKLLDGTMGLNTEAFNIAGSVPATNANDGTVDITSKLSGTDSPDFHTEGDSAAAQEAKFTVDLTGLEVKLNDTAVAADKASVEIAFGNKTYKVEYAGNGTAQTKTATDIAADLVTAMKKDTTNGFKADGTAATAAGDGTSIRIGDYQFKIGTAAAGKIEFTLEGRLVNGTYTAITDEPLSAEEAKAVNELIGTTVGAKLDTTGVTTAGAKAELSGTQQIHNTTKVQEAVAKKDATLAGIDLTLDDTIIKEGNVLTIDGQSFIFKVDEDSEITGANGTQDADGNTIIDLTSSNTNIKITEDYTKIHAAADLLSAQTITGKSDDKDGNPTANGRTWTISVKNGTTIHIDQTAKTGNGVGDKTVFDADVMKPLDSKEKIEKLFELKDPSLVSSAKVAGNVLEVKDYSKINAGDTIKVGGKKYTFVANGETAGDGEIEIGTDNDTTLDNIVSALNKGLTTPMASKENVTLANGSKGNAVVLRGATDADAPELSSSGLILQIGDTADDFNKMSVAVKDMSANGLALGDLRNVGIMTEASASDAMDKIKTAINTVSTARAGMGALQNRLEHTINNLDVAVENLSAANSRIRDTDMAKEMMNYTKMNVLVQSAQAMLAQANQQPQSVLQLLQ